MAVIPKLVRRCFRGFRVCLYHALRFCEGVGQEGLEAVDIKQHRCNLPPNAAAHHIKANGQVEQWIPP